MSRILGDTIYKEAVRQKRHNGITHPIILNIAHNVSTLRSIACWLLICDLCALVSVRKILLVLFKFIRPIMEKACLMGLGAGLLLAYVYVGLQCPPFQRTPVSYEENLKFIKNEILGVSDNSRPDSSALEQEIALLRSKTFSLDMSIRRMKMQFRSCQVRTQTEEELPDFASEAAGGSVIDTPNTETYSSSRKPEITLLGIPIWKTNYFTPRKVIQPWTEAGECWAFHGSSGKIVIELAHVILISRVTLEHIPASASLTGVIDSAPRQFTLFGQFKDGFVKLDSFTYNIDGLPSQTFSIRSELRDTPFKRIMLEVQSNWGNPDYTCIYRLKVRGRIYEHPNNVSPTKPKDEL